jgi:hypothetical protein
VRKRPVGSFRRPLASPLVMPDPCGLTSGGAKVEGNSAAVWPEFNAVTWRVGLEPAGRLRHYATGLRTWLPLWGCIAPST